MNEAKFLNNSVNYSEEYMIKKSLYKYIETYNTFLYNYNTKLNLLDKKIDNIKLIPNNNKKYYLYIQKKSNKNSTMFFFPDTNSKKYFSNFLLIKNTIDEFFFECDLAFDDNSYLLEGYLYMDANGKKHFLISDILFKNNILIETSYENRFNLINILFFVKISKMMNINNLLSIGIHNYINESLLPIFLNNFKWKQEIICVETINNFDKTNKFLNRVNNNEQNLSKKIVKTKISDIYNVYNVETNDFEGVLYISTLKVSKYLIACFEKVDELVLNCYFNTNFQKWQLDMK